MKVSIAGEAKSIALIRDALINPEDVDIPFCVSNADEAIAIIQRHKKSMAAHA